MNSSAHASAPRPRPSPRPSPHSNGANLNTPQPRYRPATIAELADRARDDHWDPSKGVKHWLKAGENHRRAGKAYVQANDLESAFVEYAKAATLVLEKLPTHREYYATLNTEQRHNLGLVSLRFIHDCCISPNRVVYEALRLFSTDLFHLNFPLLFR
jgi:STAM-binding protein